MIIKAYAEGGLQVGQTVMSNTRQGQRAIARNIAGANLGRGQSGRGGRQGVVNRAQARGMQNPAPVQVLR